MLRATGNFLGITLAYWGIASSVALAELDVKPESITLSTTRQQTITKTIQLSTDVPIQRLMVVPTDLERADGSRRVLAQQLQIILPQTTLQSRDLINLTMTIEPTVWSGSGEYSGALLIKHDQGQQTLPLIIRVKDPGWIPWLVLFSGVTLGSGLSWYRSSGLRRDQMIVRMGQLRTQLRSDPALTNPAKRFAQSVEAHLIDVETALATQNWNIAEVSLEKAQATWTHWHKYRQDWIAQLTYSQTLQNEIDPDQRHGSSTLPGTPYGQALQAKLTDFDRQIANGDPPAKTYEQLDRWRQAIHRYYQGESWLEQLRQQAKALETPSKNYWLDRENARSQQLQTLPLENLDTAFDQWQGSVKEDLEQMASDLAESPVKSLATGKGFTDRASSNGLPSTLAPVPSVSLVKEVKTAEQAQRRVMFFNWVGRGVAVLVLAWLGMVELYEENPTFGAMPMANYFTLVAWGFGAEVTRDSVVKAIQDLTGAVRREKS